MSPARARARPSRAIPAHGEVQSAWPPRAGRRSAGGRSPWDIPRRSNRCEHARVLRDAWRRRACRRPNRDRCRWATRFRPRRRGSGAAPDAGWPPTRCRRRRRCRRRPTGFTLQARCLEAVALGRVGTEACVAPAPRSIAERAANAYLDLRYEGRAPFPGSSARRPLEAIGLERHGETPVKSSGLNLPTTSSRDEDRCIRSA